MKVIDGAPRLRILLFLVLVLSPAWTGPAQAQADESRGAVAADATATEDETSRPEDREIVPTDGDRAVQKKVRARQFADQQKKQQQEKQPVVEEEDAEDENEINQAARSLQSEGFTIVNSNNSTLGFAYRDDAFLQTSNPRYAWGWIDRGRGRLRVRLGGRDDTAREGMSGGFRHSFTLDSPTRLLLSLKFSLVQSPHYESDEYSEALVTIDDTYVGQAPFQYLAHICGDGNGGSDRSTGWKTFEADLGMVEAGSHVLVLGGYNNRKSQTTEVTTIRYRDVLLRAAATSGGADAETPTEIAQRAMSRLSLSTFAYNIKTLSNFGDRTQGSSSYRNAADWVRSRLVEFGYLVEEHAFSYRGSPRTNLYVTKVGTKYPDRMFIVSAHLDGRGGGGAANDDGSGSSLVLEIARVLALPDIATEVSIRMVFWNCEETGLDGSYAYVRDRAGLQGLASPAGSNRYPEPTWLGIITHDQILYDHGTPANLSRQNPNADADIEYQASSLYAGTSQVLANSLLGDAFAKDYPAEVSGNMCCTDSVPFQDKCPSVSVRENRRVAEMEHGAAPHWHQRTDVFTSYSEEDILFGFNIVQRTLGSIGKFSGLKIVSSRRRGTNPRA
jgi:hypothetical protein